VKQTSGQNARRIRKAKELVRDKLPAESRVAGQNVRRLRKAKGLTQESLAAESGIDMRYLGMIERGEANVTVKVLADMAKALGTTVVALLVESRGK